MLITYLFVYTKIRRPEMLTVSLPLPKRTVVKEEQVSSKIFRLFLLWRH